MIKLHIWRLAALSSAALMFGASGPEAIAQTPPVAAYGALPALEDVSISPDGQTLAFLRHNGDRSEVIAQTLTGETLVVVDVSDRRIRTIDWASNDHILIASVSTEKVRFFAQREELWLLDSVNVRTRRVARVLNDSDQHGSFSTVFDWTVGEYNGRPALYVESVTEEVADFTWDVYRIDLDDGRGRRIARGDSDTRGYIVGADGTVVGRLAYEPEGGLWRLSGRQAGGWRDAHRVVARLDRPAALGLGRTAGTAMISERIGGEYHLFELSLGAGVDQQPVDLGPSPDRLYRDANGLVIGAGVLDTYMDYSFFEPKLQAAWDLLKQALPGRQLQLSDYDDGLDKIVLYVEGTGQPGAYYLYNGATKSVSTIGRAYPAIDGAAVAEVRVIRYKAQDGTDLTGFLTLPPGRQPRDLPLIMLPHGGPAARDAAGFDWWAQALASRGYAVFQPQFRGSDGFGVAFMEAGYGEWGRKMQTDVSDAIPFLAERGVIDPNRVCIAGASYGGYVALAGMTLQPGVYKCAVSVAGVSDLREMLLAEERAGARGDANPTVRYWNRFMGASGPTDRSIDAYSPARLGDKVEGPILLIHGRRDTVVPFAQSELMARAAGGRSRLVPLDGEDHYLSRASTRQLMLAETVAFLEANLPPQ